MLVEFGLVEQRYQVVLEVLEGGVSVSEVAARAGVSRQTVHRWLRRYAAQGLAGLVDRSTRCPEGVRIRCRLGWRPGSLSHNGTRVPGLDMNDKWEVAGRCSPTRSPRS